MGVCKKNVKELIDQASERFGPSFYVCRDFYDVLMQYCDIIEDIAKANDAKLFHMEVDEITTEITIDIVTPLFESYEKDDVYYKLIEHTTRIAFFTNKNGDTVVRFVFPTVWKKA